MALLCLPLTIVLLPYIMLMKKHLSVWRQSPDRSKEEAVGTHIKSAILAGVVGGLILAAMVSVLGGGPSLGQTTPTDGAQSGTGLTHDDMHRMMDAVHGTGASERMHQAMGPNAEQLIDQCVAMMAMMDNMQSMIGDGTPQGAGRQTGESMQDMMRGMMGH